MKTLPRALRRVWSWLRRPNPEVRDAQRRMAADHRAIDRHVSRIDESTHALEKRVRVNHISEAVAALLRGNHP